MNENITEKEYNGEELHLFESTSSRRAQLGRLLVAAGHGCVLRHLGDHDDRREVKYF